MKRRTGVYVMQIASMLTGLHPQTLRKYEKVGLVSPERLNTLRLYSEEDIALCRMIRRLADEMGLNLAGVELAMNTRQRLVDLRNQIEQDGPANQEQYISLLDNVIESLGGE